MASALALAVSMAMCPASLGACAMAMLSSLSVDRECRRRDRGLFVTLPALALAQY